MYFHPQFCSLALHYPNPVAKKKLVSNNVLYDCINYGVAVQKIIV